jgi:hypothetical protein
MVRLNSILPFKFSSLEVSIDVSLSFERQETVNSPALKTLGEENRLIDTATIPQTSTDSQENGHIDLNDEQTGQNGDAHDDLLPPTLNDDTLNTSDFKTELIEPTADLQEAIKAMPQEDGLDFEVGLHFIDNRNFLFLDNCQSTTSVSQSKFAGRVHRSQINRKTRRRSNSRCRRNFHR